MVGSGVLWYDMLHYGIPCTSVLDHTVHGSWRLYIMVTTHACHARVNKDAPSMSIAWCASWCALVVQASMVRSDVWYDKDKT